MEVQFPTDKPARIQTWNVKEGSFLTVGHVMFSYIELNENSEPVPGLKRYKAVQSGVIKKIHVPKGQPVSKGTTLVTLEPCSHATVMKDMCAECGIDLRKLDEPKAPSASVSMIHSVPDLRISMEQAQIIGKGDEERLLKQKKLVLLVDLDQTIIHTTNDNVPQNLKDVFHFQLWGHGSMWYHTRLRPGTREFLEKIGKLYELHICTFGTRSYAHTIAKYLDPEGKYFSDRILSRDECFSQNSKTANLKELFPRGDHMVCIIDDREDVWNFAPNLIHVKPYHFFRHTGDINAPPGLTKQDEDDKSGFSFNKDGTALSMPANDTTISNNSENVEINESISPSDNSMSLESKEEGINIENDSVSKSAKKIVEDVREIKSDLSLSDEEESVDSGKSEDANEGDKEESGDDPESSKPPREEIKTLPNEEENVVSSSQEVTPTSLLCDSSTDLKKPEESMDTARDGNVSPDTTAPIDSNQKNFEENLMIDDKILLSSETNNISVEKDDSSDKTSKFLEVEDQDDYLMYLEQILNSIHQAFYSLHSDLQSRGDHKVPDVKNVIPYVRKKVLKNVSLVFSGVVPTNIAPSDRKSSRAYAVASNLGAHVSEKFVPPNKPSSSSEIPTTHIVAARMGTAKVNEARRYKGIHIITLDWLWCCSERWERVDERLFSLFKKTSVKRNSTSSRSIRGKEHSVDPNSVVSSSGPSKSPAARKERTPSGRFKDTINPLLSFSMDEIESMGHEVDDICNESESSSSEEEDEVFKEKTLRRRSSRSKSQEINEELLQSVSKLNKNTSSSDELSSASETETGMDSSEPCLHKKRKRGDKTETETEDEPLNARFRRGEPLPSEVECLNLMNATSDDDATNDQDEEWMAQALEREFLDESSRD